MKRIAIIGAALSANKGAAAMLETVMARLPEAIGPCEFAVLTTYPEADAPKLPKGVNARVIGYEPIHMALVELPAALLTRVLRALHLPTKWIRARACRSILDADVVVDVAGISFADGRGKPILFYNALMTGIPLLVGTPTVKAAQALGPFDSTLNRTLARVVLPRLAGICARGARTREFLNQLDLVNVTDVADLAFGLDEATDLPDHVQSLIKPCGDYVIVMPSSVVRRIVERDGGNYVALMAALVRAVRVETNLSVVIAPHSYRVGKPEDRMNDGPVCREVAAACSDDSRVVGIDADLSAGELRKLIAGSSAMVTSRFHAMVSGLATCTPTVVLGWSHKYREVLSDFGMVDCGYDADQLLHPEVLVDKVKWMIDHRDEVVHQLQGALPEVRRRSNLNLDVISKAVTR